MVACSSADEAWAEASEPEEPGDTEASADEAEGLEVVADADEQDADEMPEDTSETAAEDAADIEPVQAEGDEEDPEAKATRREGLN